MGRPRFQPTLDQRRTAKSLAALGTPHEDIAKELKLKSAKTLRKHLRDELDLGAIEANAKVAQTCYQMATSGQCPQATIFWLKTRCRWNERAAGDYVPGTPAHFIVAQEGSGV